MQEFDEYPYYLFGYEYTPISETREATGLFSDIETGEVYRYSREIEQLFLVGEA